LGAVECRADHLRAFGAFRKEVVVEAGGYRSDTMGEDMELVMRLHRRSRLARRPYRIAFLINPVCWTDAPESLGVLRKQRIRWQRGLGESLARNRALLFHVRGGAVGWLLFPFLVAFELLGPLVELGGYVFMIAGFALGFISAPVFWSFMALAVCIGLMLSASALFLEELMCHVYKRPSQLVRLAAATLIENMGYHQLVLLWRLQGLWQWLVGAPAHWGDMKRSASWQKDV
jgi:cellulose synthase/poly-beta-1,6-N-acetylglucosamine synthase-like glycosyltransferase